MNRIKLAVLVSGSGTTLLNLIEKIGSQQLDAEIRLVIGSKPDLKAMQHAADAKIMSFVIERSAYADCAAFSKQVFSLCDDAEIDLVCLGGWLCLLDLPAKYQGRVMNIHPALLPSFGGKGMYGRSVHQRVLDHGCKVTGCTVHLVDATYDTGPIIIQRSCPVVEDDTVATLAQRVFEEEKIAYPQAIQLFQAGRLRVEDRRVHVLAQ